MPDHAGVNGMREEFKVVGKPNLPGVLSYAVAAGVAKFGADYVKPDMLHAKFLHSPYANAKIKKLDTTKARAIPGVVDILTWEDPDIANFVGNGEHWGAPRPWLDNIADMEGAEVGCIVVCETEDLCDEALRALDIEWEVLPHVVDIRKGAAPDAAVIFPGVNTPTTFGRRGGGGPDLPPKQGNVSHAGMDEGDADKAMAESEFTLEFDMNMPAYGSVMPNLPGSLGWWEDDPYHGGGPSLHIEGAVRNREPIARSYHMPLEKTVQEGLFMGGRYCDWGLRRSQEITPLLAKRTGRPVRCVNTREETFDFLMNQRFCHIQVGFDHNGVITAIIDNSLADAGVRGSSSFGTAGDLTYGPYTSIKCTNVKQRMDIVDSNRGMMYVSGQHCPFNWDIISIAEYLIAEKLGMDPIDVARANLHGPKEKDDTDPVPSFEACIEEGRKLMNWTWHRDGAKRLPDGRLHGASFRYQQCPRHSGMNYSVKLELRDGRVHFPTQGPHVGIYGVECNVMVAAEELGLRYEDIAVDFDYREAFTPQGGGSDGVTASAWVTKECANDLKRQILASAIRQADNPPPPSMFDFGRPRKENPLKGHKPEELDIVDGVVCLKADHSVGLPLAQATSENLFATFTGKPPLSVWSVGPGGRQLDAMNTAYCEVAVDEETGEVEILHFGVVADPGKIIRLTSLESQVDQVMYMSEGCQLLEDFIYDEHTGVRLNTNMIDYHKPTMADVPPVDKKFLETRCSNGAYGGSGISHSLANTHLVVMAIHNAIGVWVDPPATPDKVLQALGKG